VHTETLEQIQEKLSKGGAVLALAGKTYAGCVLYYPQEDYLYLGRLSVLPDFRRQGVAQALVKYVECKAAQMGIRKVQLSVRITLVNNRAFFEKLGYRVISRHSHRGYTEPTFVTLEK
jgi:ribosomal protein S18 acetylase RimI-like enzyme